MRIDRAARARALMEFEASYRVHGVCAGIDEVGRGPLAGCVLAACVVMPEEPLLQWVDDSKKLSEKRREKVYQEILDIALFVGIGRAEPEEIDEFNIRNATRLAMQRAAQGAPAGIFLVDAEQSIGLPGAEIAVVHGDAMCYSIAAASIIAKVSRDREMRELDAQYPSYGFARNKGYGTAEHMQTIREHGPCPAHRRSFLTRLLQTE